MAFAAALALALAAPRPAEPAPPRRPPARAAPRTAAEPTPPPTHVENTDIEYRYKDRRIYMTGRPLVTFTREDATLVCRKAVGENDEAGEIRRATCEGDVKLTRGERIVTCARATYEAATGKVVCRGDPVLRDGASVVHSEEVIYDLDTERVTIKHAKGTLVQKPGQRSPVVRGEKSR
jgi:lipopolysaccharide export system protein LptA